jgi:hypothetical protein
MLQKNTEAVQATAAKVLDAKVHTDFIHLIETDNDQDAKVQAMIAAFREYSDDDVALAFEGQEITWGVLRHLVQEK